MFRPAYAGIIGALCLVAALAFCRDPKPPPAGTEIVHPKDQAVMVWVPAGYFIMGMDRDEADAAVKALGFEGWEAVWAWEWMPRRKVLVDGFFIDKYEVARERWQRFAATKYYRPVDSKRAKGAKESKPGEFALYPIARVYWAEAQQYANWAGKALPSEAQWEKAARGADGRIYPWGNELPSDKRVMTSGFRGKKGTRMFAMVGSYPAGASPYGCLDMSGNVYEWTADSLEPYPNNPEAERMLSYTGRQVGCLRGGSFYHALHAYIAAKRFGLKPDRTYYHIGFRTVWAPPADYFQSAAYQKARQQLAKRKQELKRRRQQTNPNHPTSF